MTEAQAHKFIARWRRIFLLWRTRNEVEAMRRMEHSCTGMIGTAFVVFLLCLLAHHSSFYMALAWFIAAWFCFCWWLVVKLRCARRALNSPIGNCNS
ncbi:MAG TPA: hypothetical protein VIJ24_00375 [Verrucomicrobiae bacterium]